MIETNEERLKRITEYVQMSTNTESTPLLNFGDLNWLIARSEIAKQSMEKYGRLIEVHKELVIQENAMQGHYQLAFKSMQMYKKCCDGITLAMNTERAAEDKTKEIREILNGVK